MQFNKFSLRVVQLLVIAGSVPNPMQCYGQPASGDVRQHVRIRPDGVATGLPVERFTIQAAVDAMRKGHGLLAAARAQVRAAGADALAAGLWTNPVVDASYARGVIRAQNDPVGAVGVGVSQLLETAGVPQARRAVAQLTEQAAGTDYEMTARALELDVESACLALIAAATRVQVHAESIAELEHANQIVTARVKAGASPEYDGTRIGVAVAQSHAALAEARAALNQARGALDVAVGPGAAELVGLPAADLFAVPTPTALHEALDKAARERPDLRSAELRKQAAQMQITVARRSVLPGVTVRAGLYFGSSPGELGGTVSVGLPVPLIDRGQGTIAAASARLEAAQAGQDAAQLQAAQRIAAAWNESVTRVQALHEYLQASATRATGMVQEAESGYRAGKLSVLELVDAYIAKRDARSRAVDLAHDARQAELRLRRAVYAGASVTTDY